MIAVLLSLLAAEAPDPPRRAVPFAEGPIAQASAMTAAIAKCQAPAKVVQSAGSAIVLLADDTSEDDLNCLSAWIAEHPQSGFLKYGFIGREQQESRSTGASVFHHYQTFRCAPVA
jgi:hypothetical protein